MLDYDRIITSGFVQVHSCGFPLCSEVQPGWLQLPRRTFDGTICGGSLAAGCMPTVFVIELIPAGEDSVANFPLESSVFWSDIDDIVDQTIYCNNLNKERRKTRS